MDNLLEFETAMAGVAAGLFALMFTAVQVREEIWRQDKLRRVWAIAALVELLVVLIVTLVTLMPSHPNHWGAAIGGIGGLASVGWQVASYRGTRPAERDSFDDKQYKWGCPVSTVVFGGLTVCGLTPLWASAQWTLLDQPVTTLFSVHVASALLVWLIFSGSTEVIAVLMFSEHLHKAGGTGPSGP